jgi:hypothetical protein
MTAGITSGEADGSIAAGKAVRRLVTEFA